MEPPQRSDDSRIEVQEATWLHRYVCHAQQSSSWPQNGRSHGRRASQDQEARGVLTNPLYQIDVVFVVLWIHVSVLWNSLLNLLMLTGISVCIC